MRHWRLAVVLVLIAAYALSATSVREPAPALHPNLSDAMSKGFNLLAGKAPFTVQFSVENAEGYWPQWDANGDGVIEAQANTPPSVRFDQPGVYYPSVRLRAWGRPTVTLTQKIVVLRDEPAPSPPGKYGINQDLAWDPPEQIGPEIELMKAAGVQWVRLPIRWHWIEPEEGVYRWEDDDAAVNQVVKAGLDILAVLGGTPKWSSGVGKGDVPKSIHWDAFEPSRVGGFAAYVYTVTQHYHGRIRAYEMFNEPNSIHHWRPRPNAERFVEFLCAGYYAAKYADPANVVVVGGLNGNGLFLGWEPPEGRDFLKAIYASAGAGCFDVMAIHPFAHPTEDGLTDLQNWVDQTRDYMRAQRDPRELWLTEVGWSSGQNLWGHTTITEQQQADWVRSVYRDLVGPQKVFWYNFKEGDLDPADPEYHWGWLRPDLEPKLAYESFSALEK